MARYSLRKIELHRQISRIHDDVEQHLYDAQYEDGESTWDEQGARRRNARGDIEQQLLEGERPISTVEEYCRLKRLADISRRSQNIEKLSQQIRQLGDDQDAKLGSLLESNQSTLKLNSGTNQELQKYKSNM